MRLSREPLARMSDLQRSWVSGRERFMLCMCITIDSASTWPIQIGSRRAPPFSWRTTTYVCVPGSTPNFDTTTSIIRHPASPDGARELRGPVGSFPREQRLGGAPAAHLPRRATEVAVRRRCAVDRLPQLEGIDDAP